MTGTEHYTSWDNVRGTPRKMRNEKRIDAIPVIILCYRRNTSQYTK